MNGAHSVTAEVIHADIPAFKYPLAVAWHESSAWAQSYKINTINEEGEQESYFMKVSQGEHGRKALHGEFESTSSIHAVVGDFTPKPIAWESFKSIPGSHYYICKFYDLDQVVPEPSEFCAELAALHTKSKSPKEFFIKGFKHLLALNIQRGGPWEAMEGLETAMLEKVIPRLLKPMETDGRSIKPCLVHGDLWCGNAAVDSHTGRPLIYYPSSFYAHNECRHLSLSKFFHRQILDELGNWRPERNKFPSVYFNTYHSHIPKSFPEEDYDDRNALYSMRFNMQAAAIFPDEESFRESVTDEMKRLIAKFPDGHEGYEKLAETSTAA
ncbi:Fructosamine kinase-domain-containing protein [Leptodontidium sp. MPI-SDFR-AT-0119]|nr:Fructosamine kinase-domain-containing protein [Leptodontidium sp. MPI-SDFR-AT-0119]